MGARTQDQALKIALQYIAKISSPHKLVIQEGKTLKRSFGWVFFPTTRKYVETGDPAFLVPGAGPIIIERESGRVVPLTTSVSPAKAIDEFEKMWKKNKKFR